LRRLANTARPASIASGIEIGKPASSGLLLRHCSAVSSDSKKLSEPDPLRRLLDRFDAEQAERLAVSHQRAQ
jgi:hypothetical protein